MLQKFNTLIRIGIVLYLIVPTPSLAYHVTTQAPYNQSLAIDTTTGDITIGIFTSDGFEDSPAEKYTIFFDIDNDVSTSSFCVSTSFGHTGNREWNYHTFSLSDLQTYFENPYGNFRVKIRADNDTDNSFSDLTAQMNIDIPNQLPFVNLVWNGLPQTTCNDTSTTTTTTVAPPPTPNNAINVSVNYQGQDVFFEWEYADGDVDAHAFHINYSYDNTNFTRVIIEDTTLREYTLGYEYIETGTFYWNFSVCGDLDNGESCTESDANNFETTEYTPPKTTPPTTQAPAPEPDPEPYVPPTTIPEKVEVVMDDGTVSDYTPSAVADGTVDRDNQRAANEAAYGCYMTDAQIDRGDCDIPDTLPIEYPDEDDVIIEVDDDEQKPERKTELPSDDDVVPTVVMDVEDTDSEGENKGEPVPPILPIEDLDSGDVTNIEILTEEQVEVVAEVLQVQTEDVEIIAEAIQEDEVVAEAVEEYVERAVENADVENYTLADVVTEVQFETFLENPIETFVDVDFTEISIGNIGDDMTNDQKEKAQEVVVPVILTRIASMAAFMFRRGNV